MSQNKCNVAYQSNVAM
jgi:hypothetical protein